MTSINSIKNPSYKEDGFEIHDVFSHEQQANLAVDFYNRVALQAYKINLINDFQFKEYGERIAVSELDQLILSVNSKNKRSIDFAVQELRECPSFLDLISLSNKSSKFLDISSAILNCPRSLLKIHIDGILVNVPSNTQRLYRFHSEQHYYPYRKNFFNFWMPLFRDKTKENGTMLIKHKAHKKIHSFAEYNGYDKIEGNEVSEENFFYQLEIPEIEINEFQELITDLKEGQGLFFHSNTPHCSTVNTSKEVSYSLIIRVYDYRRDLTLSDRTGIKSYSTAAAGFPGIRPYIENHQS